MPLYKMRGLDCGSTSTIYASMAHPPTTAECQVCGCKAKRVFTPPATPAVFQEHFNHSVGRRVSSMADFKSALSQGSDEASEQTGMEHKYSVVEAGDAPGVTE